METAKPGVSVLSLCEKGDAYIMAETGKVFKKEKEMKKGEEKTTPVCLFVIRVNCGDTIEKSVDAVMLAVCLCASPCSNKTIWWQEYDSVRLLGDPSVTLSILV